MSESANERRLDPLVGFQSVFSTPPDFVNAEGVKWWRDKEVERYANNEDQHGTRLQVQAWIVERKDGYRTRLLIENGQIIGEAQSLEAIGAKIDWLKTAKRFDEVKPNTKAEGRASSHLPRIVGNEGETHGSVACIELPNNKNHGLDSAKGDQHEQ